MICKQSKVNDNTLMYTYFLKNSVLVEFKIFVHFTVHNVQFKSLYTVYVAH